MSFSRSLILFLGILFLAGGVQFLAGINGEQARRAWQVYLVNFVFFTGLSSGAILFSAILTMTHAGWGRPLKRLAEGMGAFLAVSFLLFWVLYFGREEIFPWAREPVQGKEAWLNTGFLFARDGIGLLILTALSLGLLYYSVRPDRYAAFLPGPGPEIPGGKELTEKSRRAQTILSPLLAMVYALVLSLIAFDLIMSLDPHWYSTLFGAYYFIGSFYSALAALVLIAGIFRIRMGLQDFILPGQFSDLGKLLLGFCLITGDFFYSQFLVIWYGNLPEETRYVILRVRESPWEPLAWTVLLVCFALPFVVLLSRKIKFHPPAMMALAGVILAGMWLERFLLVVPSTWKVKSFPLGLMEALITAGFIGLFGLTLVHVFRKFSPLPLSDPEFNESLKGRAAIGSAGNHHE
jgi:Ni/Fe-hydrogenase subunit HybB-like protein